MNGAPNCAALFLATGISWVFGSAGTALLFFFRIRALYRESLVVVGVFAFLWLSVIAGALTLPISNGTKAAHVLPGELYCVSLATFPAYAGSAIIIPAVYDTLVFFAVSYRLYPTQEASDYTTWKQRIGLFFTGKGLPRLSKALLQGGQQYYL